MALIPEDTTVTIEDIINWYEISEQLKKLRAKEILLRQRVFRGCFPDAKEGVNHYPLPPVYIEGEENNHSLKADRKILRTIDQPVFEALKNDMREKHAINPDLLVKYKPELVLKEYRKLTNHQRKIFDQVLTIKDGTPQLKIEQVKKKKKKNV